MVVVQPQAQIEIVLQSDKSLCIRETDASGESIQIRIPPSHVIYFENCLIRLLENYNG